MSILFFCIATIAQAQDYSCVPVRHCEITENKCRLADGKPFLISFSDQNVTITEPSGDLAIYQVHGVLKVRGNETYLTQERTAVPATFMLSAENELYLTALLEGYETLVVFQANCEAL